jgi:hypothetical protein
MALDCCDVSDLQISTRRLNDLFVDLNMPAVCKLAMHMEEFAREYQFEGVKNLLRAIKKIIRRVVDHNEKHGD